MQDIAWKNLEVNMSCFSFVSACGFFTKSNNKTSTLFQLWHNTCIQPFHSPFTSQETKRLISTIKSHDKNENIASLKTINVEINNWLRDRPETVSKRRPLVLKYQSIIHSKIAAITNQLNSSITIPKQINHQHNSIYVTNQTLMNNITQNYGACVSNAKNILETIENIEKTNGLTQVSLETLTKLSDSIKANRNNISYIRTHNSTVKVIDKISIDELNNYFQQLSKWLTCLEKIADLQSQQHQTVVAWKSVEEYQQSEQRQINRCTQFIQKLRAFTLLPLSGFLIDANSIFDSVYEICNCGIL